MGRHWLVTEQTTPLYNIVLKMTLSEIIASEAETDLEIPSEVEAPLPSAAKKKKKAKKSAKKSKKAKKYKKAKKAKKSKKPKKSKKSRKSRKRVKKSKAAIRAIRRARRAKAKKARGGLTLSQFAVKSMKNAKKPVTAEQLQKHMKSTKISLFVLGHVLKQLKAKGVVKARGGNFSLTGKRLPKAKTAHLFKKGKKVAKKVTKKSKKVKRSVKARK